MDHDDFVIGAVGVASAAALALITYAALKPDASLNTVRTWDVTRYPKYRDFLQHASVEQLTGDLPGLGQEVYRFANSWDQDGPMVLHNRYFRDAIDNSSEAIVSIGKQLPKTVKREMKVREEAAKVEYRAKMVAAARGPTLGGHTVRINTLTSSRAIDETIQTIKRLGAKSLGLVSIPTLARTLPAYDIESVLLAAEQAGLVELSSRQV